MSTWKTLHDDLFGPYRARALSNYRGRCFNCDGIIEGDAIEKERGGTKWIVHETCPASLVRKGKKR